MSFKHTQELFGRVIDAKIVPQEKEQRRKFYDGIAQNIRFLQTLAESPGYKMLQAELHDEERLVIDQFETVKDPVQLGKVAGVMLAIRSYKTWAEDRVVELTQVLQERDDA